MATSTADLSLVRAGKPTRAGMLPGSPALKWALGFAVWTALALLSALQFAVAMWANGMSFSWASLLPRSLIDWYTCAIFTPLYFWMVRRWPLSRTDMARTLGIYLGITALMTVAKFSLSVPLINAITADPARHGTLRASLTRGFITENIAFWCMLAAVIGIEYYRTLREREMQEARLQTQLAEARLDALAAQLHPHFLFNTIQGISTLIHRDPHAADGMLARLSALLRHTLQRESGHEITLHEELELLALYLGIVQERFGDRLTVTFAVADDVRSALLPRFLLQPLVENALHHGIARRAGAGHVEIRAQRAGEVLELSVVDDGAGFEPARRAFPQEGIGLGNTRSRLAQLYGAAQSLETAAGENGGFVVTVRIPWHEAADA